MQSWMGREKSEAMGLPAPLPQEPSTESASPGKSRSAAFNPPGTRQQQGKLRGADLASGPQPASQGGTWRGRQVLAPPGSPLPPAATHELQGGGCGQLASRPALPLSGTRKRFVQPDTSLSGISATPERASNGGSVTQVPQVPLPAQTCPGAHCLRSKGSINSLGRHLWPFHLATTNPSRKTSF